MIFRYQNRKEKELIARTGFGERIVFFFFFSNENQEEPENLSDSRVRADRREVIGRVRPELNETRQMHSSRGVHK